MEGVNRVEGSNIAVPDVVARVVKVCANFPKHTPEQLKDQVGEEDVQKLCEALQTITSQQFIDKVCEEVTQHIFGEQVVLQQLQELFEYLQIISPLEQMTKVGGEEALKILCASLNEAAEKIYACVCQACEEVLKNLNTNSEKLKVELGEEAFQNMCAGLNKCIEDRPKLCASFNGEYEEGLQDLKQPPKV